MMIWYESVINYFFFIKEISELKIKLVTNKQHTRSIFTYFRFTNFCGWDFVNISVEFDHKNTQAGAYTCNFHRNSFIKIKLIFCFQFIYLLFFFLVGWIYE